jgi:hypothetical protein
MTKPKQAPKKAPKKVEEKKEAKKAPEKQSEAKDKFGSIVGSSNAIVNALLTTTAKSHKQLVEESGLTKKQVRFTHLNKLVAEKKILKSEDGYRLK